MGHVEEPSLGTLQLDAHTGTDVISVATTTTTYKLGISSLMHIEDTIWFGGGIDDTGNAQLPVLGSAPSGSLVVDKMWQMTPAGGDLNNFIVDQLYSSNDPTHMLIYGLGLDRKNDASGNVTDTLKEMMLIIGKD